MMSRSWPLLAGSAPLFTSGVLLHRGWEQGCMGTSAANVHTRDGAGCKTLPPICRQGS